MSCLEKETFDYCDFSDEDRRRLQMAGPKLVNDYTNEEDRITEAQGRRVFDRFSDRLKVRFSKYAGPKYAATISAAPMTNDPPPVCSAYRSEYVFVKLCEDRQLAEEIGLSRSRQQEISGAYRRLSDELPSPFGQSGAKLAEIHELVEKSHTAFRADVFASLSESQTVKLNQWAARKYFEANPGREFANPDLRKYLAMDPEESMTIDEVIRESKKLFELQRQQLNRETIQKIAAMVEPSARERFLKLFSGVW